MLEMSKSETLLEQIVRQAQHVVLRLRTIFVLDTLAREFKDPLLTSHWSTLSSPTCSSVKVSVVSAGYDTIIRTSVEMKILRRFWGMALSQNYYRGGRHWKGSNRGGHLMILDP